MTVDFDVYAEPVPWSKQCYGLPFLHLSFSGLMHIIGCHCSVTWCSFSTVIGANLTFSEKEESSFSFFPVFSTFLTFTMGHQQQRQEWWPDILLCRHIGSSVSCCLSWCQKLDKNHYFQIVGILYYSNTSFSSCPVHFPSLRQFCLNVYYNCIVQL